VDLMKPIGLSLQAILRGKEKLRTRIRGAQGQTENYGMAQENGVQRRNVEEGANETKDKCIVEKALPYQRRVEEPLKYRKKKKKARRRSKLAYSVCRCE